MPPTVIIEVQPKEVAYFWHVMLYRRHQNPRKCQEPYGTQVCDACGTPHPCPAVN